MKSIKFILLLLFIAQQSIAQDSIFFKNGDVLACIINNQNEEKVFVTFIQNRSRVVTHIFKANIKTIKYADGKVLVLQPDQENTGSVEQNTVNNSEQNLINKMVTTQVENISTDSFAIVRLYRVGYIGKGFSIPIYLNNSFLIKLAPNSYHDVTLPPGEYTFYSKMNDTSTVKFTVEAGKKYYIRNYLMNGFWTVRPKMDISDNVSANTYIEGALLKKQFKEASLPLEPQKRMSFILGGGVGFEKMPLFESENGEEITLSTGGGVALVAEYGYELNPGFDISVNAFYQSSTLSQSISNGNATFNRYGFSVTPAKVFPLKGEKYQKKRLGGGLGYYLSGTIDYEASNAGGEDLILNYSPALGFHGSFVYESLISDKAAFFIGIKLYSVNYKYTSANSTGVPLDRKSSDPNGSGLDFNFGYSILF